MYIEEVIIEGFKSYATRTVIGKWDPRFNAITGLNGTGKSNILDSICFVLGITNLSHVRATNLQDLVYKKGQAGINKASVTIVFNNDDKNKSPPKYINCPKIIITRQIIIGGKNKYLINSKNETQETVSDMFHSVQLNIQNPNFLIMQGKITQVLNMKPSQILGMVEEAAGTRLYEDRKNKALKAIEKKDGKLEHSALLLETEIIPKLEELREKKRVLLEFQKVNSEKERLEKVVVAYDYTFQTNQIEKFKEKKITNDERKKHLNSMKSILGQEIAELEEEVNQVTADRAKNGGAYFEIEEQLKVVNKEMAKLKTQHTLKSQTIKDEVENIKIIDQNVTDLCQSLETSKLKTEDLMNQSKTTMLEFTNKQKYINETENLFQTLTTGLSAKEGQENGYLNQLSVAKQEQNNCSSEIQQLKLRLSHLQEEIKVEEPKAKIARKENASLLAELESNKNILQMINSELNCISFDPSLEQGLVEKKTNLQQKLAEVENRIEKLERSMNSFEFKYSDPCENFDRSKVKGLVATLITIPKEHLNKANALEVCAGGKLYQVVVEDEKVGSLLIEKGKLQKRVTIIPLNKISDFKVQAERIATAKQLAPGAVDLALSLIGSDSEVQKAMNFVFGNTLICRDPSVSKKVTFDKRVNMRSVTLDGDVYDPSGQLTGGARSNSSGSLLKLQNLQQLQAEASTLQIAFKRAESELHDFQSQKQLLTKMKENKTLKEHELKLLEERMNNNPHFRVIQNVEQLIQRHKETKESIQTSKEKLVKLNEKIVSIEKEMSELNDDRDTKLKSLQNQIKQAKKELARLEPLASQMEQNILLSKEDSVQLELEIEKVKLQSTNANQLLSQLKSEYSQIESELKIVEAKQNQWLVKLNEEKSVLASFDKELQALEKSFKIKNQQLEDVKLEIQKLVSETSSIAESLQKAEKSLNHLVKSHTWIEDQKQLFGIEGGLYDFTSIDIEECQKRIVTLTAQFESLNRHVDRSVLEKFDRVEKKENSLQKKLNLVKKDKTSITSTLEYLDRKKLEQLKKTWKKVNIDFGAIFGDLLPGNTCKLEIPEGMDITEGLEVRVCLGGVWKSSLTELSGGQRSLIALSLILALLQFNPAPMYILDEIDAALDLSHTQNIGKLLKTRFRTSQFILVSLKDGMYNNANVLFRTKFVEGVSQVERREQKLIPVKSKGMMNTPSKLRIETES